ncbi:doublesex and mab-3 related transcription factor 1-like isoform X1, partial [Clarias magur]
QCEYYIPQTPLSAVYPGDLPLPMPLPLHGRYASVLAQPGFMVSLGMPALGPVTFPHVPPAALVEHRQEAPGFFYVPYLPHPDLHQPGVWERVDDVVVSPLRDGPDS